MRSAIYPRRAAAILGQDRSGEKYKPRTDTDQDSFFAAWCRQCQRDKAMRDGCDIDECDDNYEPPPQLSTQVPQNISNCPLLPIHGPCLCMILLKRPVIYGEKPKNVFIVAK